MANTQTNVQYVDCLAIARNLQGTRYPRIQFHAVDDVETARIINGYDNQGVPVLDFITNKTRKLRLTNEGVSLLKGANVSEFSVDGTLSDNSDNAVPTEKAVKTYVDTKVSDILIGNVTANTVSYDNSISGLLSTNVQSVVDEINSNAMMWIGEWVPGTYSKNTMTTDTDLNNIKSLYISNATTDGRPAEQSTGTYEHVYDETPIWSASSPEYYIQLKTEYTIKQPSMLYKIRYYGIDTDNNDQDHLSFIRRSNGSTRYLSSGYESQDGWTEIVMSSPISLNVDDTIEHNTYVNGLWTSDVAQWRYDGVDDIELPNINEFNRNSANTIIRINSFNDDGDQSTVLDLITIHSTIKLGHHGSDIEDALESVYYVNSSSTIEDGVYIFNVELVAGQEFNGDVGVFYTVNTFKGTLNNYAVIDDYLLTNAPSWANSKSYKAVNGNALIQDTNGYGFDVEIKIDETSSDDWDKVDIT